VVRTVSDEELLIELTRKAAQLHDIDFRVMDNQSHDVLVGLKNEDASDEMS
jgi:hypothetical protein